MSAHGHLGLLLAIALLSACSEAGSPVATMATQADPAPQPNADPSSGVPTPRGDTPTAEGAADRAAQPPPEGSPDPSGDGSTDPLPPTDAGATPGASPEDPSVATLMPDPSWDCGMPAGLPVPERGALVFELSAQLGEVRDVGRTPSGERALLGLSGGALEGPRIGGQLLEGGLDWQLTLADGVVEVEQVALLETDDGEHIYMRTCGVAPTADAPVRVVLDLEVRSAGPHGWLDDSILVGTREVDAQAGVLTMAVYDVTGVDLGAPEDAIEIAKPAGIPAQPWDCTVASGSQGAVAFTENVRIGGSIRVGQGKRGNRNAIPITGGSTSGRVQGSVLPGGADFQLLDNGFELDARYTLLTDDGELILVRNCGPGSALVPRFETRADGPYAWLNEDAWLSSSPGISIGAVNITIYERN